jgi:GNAT superfamily N-acetyltransferase
MAVGLTSPVLVGRDGQLRVLQRAFDQARGGSPGVVLLGGEAGAGKTRLITEFGGRLAGQAVALTGGCVDLGGSGLAYAPFTAALRGLLREMGAASVASLVPGGMRAELSRLLPALGGAPSPGSAFDEDAGTARARMFEELLGLLENLADQQPVMLVIEDVHWADRSSRELLTFLARNLQAPSPLLMVVSYRTNDLGHGHPMRSLLAELERLPWVQRVDLPPLSRREVVAQARAILGGLGSAAMIEEVVRRADGIPLFVEMLLDSGGQLPGSLADLLLVQAGRLPEGTQRVLGAAAIAGAWFGQRLLEAATGLDEMPLSEALRPAVAAGVLVTADEGYRFRHALIREAMQASLLPGERRRWHARLAEALEAGPALAPDGRAAAEVAHHWQAAGQPDRALPAAWRAAAQAAAALAYAEQLVLLDRVLSVWDEVPDAAGLTGASRLAVLERAVTAAHLAGEPERGVMLADAALAEPGARDDPVCAFFLHERRSAMSLQLGHADVTGLAAAAGKVGDDDQARPRVLAALAEQLIDGQQPDEAYECGEQALAAARRHRDLTAEAGALVTVAALAARRGELAAQLPRLAEAEAIAEQAGARQLLLRALHWEASVLEAHGQHERAAAAARRGLAAAAAPEARGQGVARALIAAVKERALRQGCARLYWHTQAANHTARRLYGQVAENRGFIQYLIEL